MVLTILGKTKEPYEKYNSGFITHIIKEDSRVLKIYENEVISILNKLTKDGYVEIDIVKQPFEDIAYSITFEGVYFITILGGYQEQDRIRNQEKQRLTEIEKAQKKLELRQFRMAKRSFWTNIAIALGTSAAAVYYLIEIGNYLHWWNLTKN